MNDVSKFHIGDIVYHRVDGQRGMVTGILWRQHGVVYLVTWPSKTESYHFDMELSVEKVYEQQGAQDEGT